MFPLFLQDISYSYPDYTKLFYYPPLLGYSFSQGKLFYVSISFLHNSSLIKKISKYTVLPTVSFQSTGSSF